MSQEFVFYKEQGRITNPIVLEKAFGQLPDGAYICRFHTRRQRSISQNSYYHSVVVDLVREGLQHAGFDEVKTNEDAHEILKEIFLKKQIHSNKNDDTIIIHKSTAELTTVEFNHFIEEVAKWAAEYLSIEIPAPNTQLKAL